mmetsp:Transcript_3775/g.10686  ORF Transcript_3775/g.10686 Transcript_3775/m.10686 type:complete len:255 (-) Transcript_3775:36-800(-)
MAEADEIIVVAKCDDAPSVGFGDGEQTFQYVPDALAEVGIEIVEKDVRIGLAHGAGTAGQIVTEDGAAQGKEGGGAQGQVAHDQPVGLAARFLHHDDVGKVRFLARRYQLVDPVVAAVDPGGVGKQQLDLLGKLLEPRAGIAAGRDAHHRLGEAGVAVLVVDVVGQLLRLFVLGVHLGLQGVVAGPHFGGEGPPGRQRLADDALLLVRRLVASLETFAVQIFAAETGLAPRRGGLRGGGHGLVLSFGLGLQLSR